MSVEIEVDGKQLLALADELGLTEKQAKFALGQALRRTAATLRRLAEKGLRSELDIKKVAYLRKRLKSIRFRGRDTTWHKLWFGMNDMPVSALKGTITDSKKGGATFTGKAGSMSFTKGFVVRSKRGFGRTILFRKSGARVPLDEAALPVKDKMEVFISDNVFVDVEQMIWKNFERDMMARAKYGVGNTDYRKKR